MKMKRNKTKTADRSASVIIEVVLSAALLATAGVALAKLSRGAGSLSQQADQHLAAELAADNVLNRLASLPADEVKERAAKIAKAVAEDTGCEVDTNVESFESGDARGVHVRVEVTTEMAVRVVRHAWRLQTPEEKS